MPITHEWNGTILTITSDSGTSSADLKGQKGDDGARGAQGIAGSAIAEDTAKLGGIVADEYATKAYVDTAISNADIDLTPYATKDYVNTAVDNVDLSNYYNKTEVDSTVADINRNMEYYATKDYVDTAVSNVEVDLTDYATKTYVDDAVANVEVDLTDYATKEYVEEAVSGLGGSSSIAYNLLDNSDFTNPINQRGQTTYSGAGYTIDRWRLTGSSHTLTKNEYSITVNGELLQYIAGYPAGKTFSFFYGNETETIEGSVGYDTNNGYYYVSLPTGTWTWASLYEGEYTTETMPKYMPKGYAVEMLECQRYFFALDVGYLCFGSVNQSGSVFYGTIETPAEMRITPSILTTSNKYSLCNNESQVDMTGTITVQRRTGTVVQIMLTVTGTGMKKAIVSKLWFTEGSARGYLVADL